MSCIKAKKYVPPEIAITLGPKMEFTTISGAILKGYLVKANALPELSFFLGPSSEKGKWKVWEVSTRLSCGDSFPKEIVLVNFKKWVEDVSVERIRQRVAEALQEQAAKKPGLPPV